jgi:hypothetical protein
MIPDLTRSTEPGLRSATTANGTFRTGLPTTADQLDVQLHLALMATRAEFRAARIAAMKWDLSDEG